MTLPVPFPPYFACAWGDDSHGLWSSFEVGGVEQRMRWIEPGIFQMGSPEGEAERYEDEGPQHEVRLTREFWLGETACTQGLWRAVMGENPSDFKGDALPVESVSWEGVQEFLKRLQRLLPGVEADLPTEAEWEYACRAGTETAYNFGGEIDREKANYGGIEEKSKGTVAVKGFAPNAWGLYEMHGNVWEWCRDGQREYDGTAQENPTGPEDKEARRAVRGGSWFGGAWDARSAYRLEISPGDRDGSLGFRLALRSIEPSRGQVGGPA